MRSYARLHPPHSPDLRTSAKTALPSTIDSMLRCPTPGPRLDDPLPVVNPLPRLHVYRPSCERHSSN